MAFKRMVILFIALLLLTGHAYSQTTLKSEILKIINESVFEVVVLKPTNDSLTYEKELPLDLIPYAIRIDKYYSVGTAFAISKDRFASAVHVFNMFYKSQFDKIYIRDKDKKVYEVDQVFKFSDNRDFIIFNAKGINASKYLKINPDPKLNQNVFAVGNAYGEGIIVRDGMFTSMTPEEENGEWEWIRFSAAVNPGNSGGPLLDEDGNIIGIVTRKNENENLNFAIPFSVINKMPENEAICHKKIKYLLPNMNGSVIDNFDYETSLPKNILILKNDLIKQFQIFGDNLLQKLLDDNKDTMFPNGKKSLPVLHTIYDTTFPNMLAEGKDSRWNVYSPEKTHTSELDENGYIEWGNMYGYTFLYFRRPDNIPLETIYNSPQVMIDEMLKGVPLHRYVMDEPVKIISMGNAVDKYFYTDKYRRKWIISSWNMEYNDAKLMTVSLPVPAGLVTILKIGQTGSIDGEYLSDLKVMLDFICISYYGTFEQWTGYLKLKNYVPDYFSDIKFLFTENKIASFKSKRFSVQYNSDILKITKDSDMKLSMEYFVDNGKVVWDIAKIIIGGNKNSKNYFKISRELKPVDGLPDSYTSNWEKIYKMKHPFNGTPFQYENKSYITTIYPKYAEMNEGNRKNIDFLYYTEYGREGKIKDKLMKKTIKVINTSVKIIEGD